MNRKIRSEEAGYKENVGFWTNKSDGISVPGDFARFKAIELLDPKSEEHILDAGCGAGWISRKLAPRCKQVVACDREPEMIKQAKMKEHEDGVRCKILYDVCDITKLPYSDQIFDAVLCVAVLMHDSPQQILAFLREAYRVLKPGGRLLTSLTHPDVYRPGSPSRTGEASWLQLKPLENKSTRVSHRYEETYRNAKGDAFVSTVWYHPEKLFTDLFRKVGINPVHEQSVCITQEMLDTCNHTGGLGTKGFYQLLGRKPF